jgi:hypothetical protein
VKARSRGSRDLNIVFRPDRTCRFARTMIWIRFRQCLSKIAKARMKFNRPEAHLRVLNFLLILEKPLHTLSVTAHSLRSIERMKSCTGMITVTFAALLTTMPATMRAIAQDHTQVPEPPIPVYFEYANHSDSLRATQEGSILTNGSSLGFLLRRYDSLEVQMARSKAQSTAHFIWLYSLIAALGAMNVILLYFVSRIRKELSEIRRLEHHQLLAGTEASREDPFRNPQKSSGRPARSDSKRRQA